MRRAFIFEGIEFYNTSDNNFIGIYQGIEFRVRSGNYKESETLIDRLKESGIWEKRYKN